MKRFLLFVILFSGCFQRKPIEILEFTTRTHEIDSVRSENGFRLFYNYFFLVKNFERTKSVEGQIDSFAREIFTQRSFANDMERVQLFFYKESNKTNIAEIIKNPNEVDRYSNQHDLVYSIISRADGTVTKEEIKNGVVISTSRNETPKLRFKVKKVQGF